MAVSRDGSFGGRSSPGLIPETGLQVASIHPGPTCDQGMVSIAASTPCAAGCATGTAVGAEVSAAGLAGESCTAGWVDDAHPASVTAVNAAINVVLVFIAVVPCRVSLTTRCCDRHLGEFLRWSSAPDVDELNRVELRAGNGHAVAGSSGNQLTA